MAFAPSLRGTVVERPGAAEAAREALAAAGLADRSDVVAGSFFDPLPPGGGGYMLSAVLHNWSDEAAGAILERCAEAAGKAGTVLVVEKVGDEADSTRTERDLRMLAYFGGRERDLRELTDLAAASGLRPAAAHQAGPLVILELVAD